MFLPVVSLRNHVLAPGDMARVPAGAFRRWDGKVAHLPEFYIDRHEVTNEAFATFVQASDYRPRGKWKQYAGPGKERHPVVSVTLQDAQEYARYRNRRLPTAWEWQKALGGAQGMTYPWGMQWKDGAANVNSASCAPVGSFPQDCSPYGVFDLAGNVFEWTATSLAHGPAECVVLGGGWAYYKEAAAMGRAASFVTVRPSCVIGFRCAWP